MWPKPHSHREHVRPFQVPACICHTPGMFSSPTLNECHFKWHCPVSNPVIILSWFLLRLSNSSAFFTEGFFLRMSLACLFQHMDSQCSSCFLLFHSLIMPGNLCRCTKHRPRSHEWMWGACSDQLISCFISINFHVSHLTYQLPLLCSASFTRDWWPSQNRVKLGSYVGGRVLFLQCTFLFLCWFKYSNLLGILIGHFIFSCQALSVHSILNVWCWSYVITDWLSV